MRGSAGRQLTPGIELRQSSAHELPAAGTEAAVQTMVISGVPAGGTWQKARKNREGENGGPQGQPLTLQERDFLGNEDSLENDPQMFRASRSCLGITAAISS